jgi:hypothetical protein
MAEKKGSCGPHTQLVSNDNVRISQCPCGAYHVALVRKGVSVQLGAEEVRALSEGFGVALKVADAEARGRLLADGDGSSINLLAHR